MARKIACRFIFIGAVIGIIGGVSAFISPASYTPFILLGTSLFCVAVSGFIAATKRL